MSSFTEEERIAARQMSMEEFIEHYSLDYFTPGEIAQYRFRHGIDDGGPNGRSGDRLSTRSLEDGRKP